MNNRELFRAFVDAVDHMMDVNRSMKTRLSDGGGLTRNEIETLVDIVADELNDQLGRLPSQYRKLINNTQVLNVVAQAVGAVK